MLPKGARFAGPDRGACERSNGARGCCLCDGQRLAARPVPATGVGPQFRGQKFAGLSAVALKDDRAASEERISVGFGIEGAEQALMGPARARLKPSVAAAAENFGKAKPWCTDQAHATEGEMGKTTHTGVVIEIC